MNRFTPTLRTARRLSVICVIASLATPAVAESRPYTVVSCDSASAFGHAATAWTPYGNAGRAYQTCPSSAGFTSGVSNRLTGEPFSAFQHSGHAFVAPPGATITHIRWAGRMARDNCQWGAFIRAMPSGTSVLGYPNGRFCDATEFDNRRAPISLKVPSGTTRLEQLVICGASHCSPGAAIHAQEIEVTIDDPTPPSVSLSGPLVSGRWVSGRAGGSPQVLTSAADNSGVQRIEASLGGRRPDQSFGCNWAHPSPCPAHAAMSSTPGVADLSDGRHTLVASAADAAGNVRTVSREIYVDNTAPDPVLPTIDGGVAWRRTNRFSVSWSNPPNAAAPIVRAHWKLCIPDGTCGRGQLTSENVQRLPLVSAPGPGDFRLHVWLEDAAGNQREANAPLSVPIRYDPEPPELAFMPPDPADPLRVAVSTIDRHSGIAAGEIEMRPAGGFTWHGLRTERTASQIVAYVDDERFRNGAYELRARANDHAGNEASTGERIDGLAARFRLPARIETRLRVGIPRRGVGRGRRRLLAHLDANVVARYGSRLRLLGKLTNADGHPIDVATIEALQEDADGSLRPVGIATTGADGKFRYVLRANRNRDVLFRYGGSRRIGVADDLFRLRVPAATSIAVSRDRVRNGESVTFRGRVAGRPVPTDGKLIEVQAHFRGRWRTFSTVRSDVLGRWRFPYRFGATLGRVIYRFRVRLPAEGGYPFITGHSRTAKVVVVGP